MTPSTPANIRSYIQHHQLIGISFVTTDRPETVHPRIIESENRLYVYGRTKGSKLGRIELTEFLLLLTRGAPGLAVGATRKSDGRQTSISFSKPASITYSTAFARLLQDFA